jgi:signal transduction histidine kinase
MKSIRKKIAIPLIIMILTIPAVSMLLFNTAMNLYIERSTRKELSRTISGIEALVRQQVFTGYLDKLTEGESDVAWNNLNTLRSSLRVSRLTGNIEFLMLDSENKLLFPKDLNGSFLTEKLIQKAEERLAQAEDGALVELNSGGRKYFATGKSLTGNSRDVNLIFIASRNALYRITGIINLMLLCILVIAAAAGILIALRISRELSQPIIRLSGYADRIGRGEFLSLNPDYSSKEIHELTDSMSDMSNRLKNYDNAQKAFLQNASHELRTPLMNIQGYAEGMEKGVFTDSVETAGIIREESLRLNTLVEELLTLSRIENQTYQGELITINLVDMLKEYIQRLAGYALKEGKTIELLADQENIPVKIHETLLQQALVNIVSNGIRYAHNKVSLSAISLDHYVLLRIFDDGEGIAEADLPHVFERFYKGKKGSFGLGLSIAKSAIEYMGGGITAYNDSGAVFEIILYR